MIDNSNHNNREWGKLRRKRVSLPIATSNPNKKYDLLYRGEIILRFAPYPMCIAKRSEKIREGTHTKDLFEIKRIL